MMAEQITIFGSGFVADALAKELKKKFNLLRFSQYENLKGINQLKYSEDLYKYEQQIIKSKLIIIAVGTGNLDFCEYSEIDCRKQHQTVVEDICLVLKNFDNLRAQIINISSDKVFSAIEDELCTPSIDDVPNPNSIYGKVKRDCELIVTDEVAGHNLRLPALMFEEYHKNNFISTCIRNILSNEEMVIDKKLIPRYFTSLSTISGILENFDFQNTQNKIHHFSNQKGFTYLEMAYKIADYLQIEKNKINFKLEKKDKAKRSHVRLISSFHANYERDIDQTLIKYFSNKGNF